VKRLYPVLVLLTLYTTVFALRSKAQSPDVKFIADTLVVQADGTYEADPDLATLKFDVSAQDKDLKQTYDKASQAIQKIVALADRNGLARQDVSSGVLTVRPFYEGDRKKRAKSYLVKGQVILRVRDFAKLGPLLDGSIEDGITDFRSLTYSLSDEEAAKQHAVNEAMRRALGRAGAALEPKGQKVGVLRFVNLDVKQLVGLSNINPYEMAEYNSLSAPATSGVFGMAHKAPPPPPPPLPQAEKITVSATVQCAFQIQ